MRPNIDQAALCRSCQILPLCVVYQRTKKRIIICSVHNPDHVLHRPFSSVSRPIISHSYSFRPRVHDKSTGTPSDCRTWQNCDFIMRVLFCQSGVLSQTCNLYVCIMYVSLFRYIMFQLRSISCLTSMSVLLIVGPKCALAASHAAP